MASDKFDHQLVQSQVLLPERGAGIEHGHDQLGDQRIACNSLAYRLRETAPPKSLDADAERLQGMADRVLQIQIAPMRQQQPKPVAGFALDVRLPEPAGAHDVGNPKRNRPCRSCWAAP
jgi:hypothetical protein